MKNNPLIFTFLLFLILGCNQTTKVNTGNTATSTAPESKNIKRFQINQTKTCGGLDITVGEIAIESDKITVGMSAVNKSKNVLSFFPDQKNLVIGTRQLDVNMFLGEGKISGEIQPNVEKTSL
jgi:hypothetical protein